MSTNPLFFILGLTVLICPAALVAILSLPPLVGCPLNEKTINRYAYAATVIGLLASLAILAMMLVMGIRYVPIELGNWVAIPQQEFHFHLKFVFDRLSVPFIILSFLLCGTVSAFTSHYLHRESGYGRFYVCYSFFLLGMILSLLAGTIEVLFFGWELVGLSSALLVAYFHERPVPVTNGLRVWSVYRIADAAFLMAAIAMHHFSGAGDFDRLVGRGYWPDAISTLTSGQALTIGLLLLVAAAGKSALVPFSGWLPRAMEGPTPSSAIFYGALSVHLGAFLLLRVGPLLDDSVPLAVAVVTVGLLTSLLATLIARVQTDIKSALAYASLTQVGIIVAEIGLGFRYIPMIHILGHACLRTLQLLRAPTLLHDYHTIENAIGGRSAEEVSLWGRMLPGSLQNWSYRFASQRGYLDGMLDEFVVHPFLRLFQGFDMAERYWTDFLSGGHSRESDEVQIHSEIIEELRR